MASHRVRPGTAAKHQRRTNSPDGGFDGERGLSAFPPPPPLPVRQDDPERVIAGDTFDAALRAMVDRAFLKSERHQGQHWRANREGAHPDILEFERKLIAEFARLGVPLFAHCVVRPSWEQDALKAQGFSKAGAGESPHNFGLAVDLVHGTKGWELTRKQWALVGHVGHEVAKRIGVKVEWGGSWKFYDPAHWELGDWRSLI